MITPPLAWFSVGFTASCVECLLSVPAHMFLLGLCKCALSRIILPQFFAPPPQIPFRPHNKNQNCKESSPSFIFFHMGRSNLRGTGSVTAVCIVAALPVHSNCLCDRDKHPKGWFFLVPYVLAHWRSACSQGPWLCASWCSRLRAPQLPDKATWSGPHDYSAFKEEVSLLPVICHVICLGFPTPRKLCRSSDPPDALFASY